MTTGVCDALDSLGLISTLVELRAVVALAFSDSEAEKGWFRGEDVFRGVDSSSARSGALPLACNNESRVPGLEDAHVRMAE